MWWQTDRQGRCSGLPSVYLVVVDSDTVVCPPSTIPHVFVIGNSHCFAVSSVPLVAVGSVSVVADR
jgi:hypothetical protein